MSDEEYEAFAGSSSASPTAVWVWSNGNLLDDDDKDEDDVWAVAEVQTIEEGLNSSWRFSVDQLWVTHDASQAIELLIVRNLTVIFFIDWVLNAQVPRTGEQKGEIHLDILLEELATLCV